jgi:V8-like Glu-specific endopeptidase
MRKALFISILAGFIAFSTYLSGTSQTQIANAATSEGEKLGRVPIVYTNESSDKKGKFLSENRVKQHQFTKEELERISKMDPNTSVGSDGSIVTIEEQQKFIKKNRIQLNGSGDVEDTSEFGTMATSDFERVTDRTSYPYRAITEIEVLWPNGTYSRCSGFFIDADTVATAGHCIYDTYSNVYAIEAVVYPFGRTDGIGHFSNKFYVSSSWINVTSYDPNKGTMAEADFAKDYGVIDLLGAPANDNGYGWFAIRDYNHEVGEGINLSGFPDGMYGNNSSYDVMGDGLYRSLGNVIALDTYLIKSSAFSWHGMSGGPSFNTKNGTTAAIGITNGTTAQSINDPESGNHSLSARIVGYTKTNLEYWSGL